MIVPHTEGLCLSLAQRDWPCRLRSPEVQLVQPDEGGHQRRIEKCSDSHMSLSQTLALQLDSSIGENGSHFVADSLFLVISYFFFCSCSASKAITPHPFLSAAHRSQAAPSPIRPHVRLMYHVSCTIYQIPSFMLHVACASKCGLGVQSVRSTERLFATALLLISAA